MDIVRQARLASALTEAMYLIADDEKSSVLKELMPSQPWTNTNTAKGMLRATPTAKKETKPPQAKSKEATSVKALLEGLPDGDVQVVKGPLYLLAKVPKELYAPFVQGLSPDEWLDKAAVKQAAKEGADKALMQDIVAGAKREPRKVGEPLELSDKFLSIAESIDGILGSKLHEQLVVELMQGEQNVPDASTMKLIGAIARAMKVENETA